MTKDPTDTFGEFYRASYRGLVGQLYAFIGDLSDAQEVAQDAFARAWVHWRKVSEYDEPFGWVCRVAYRIAVSRWRHAKSVASSWRRHGPPPPHPTPNEDSFELLQALRRLPETQRRALVLHHMGGFRIAEIAQIEDVAEGTVKARLSRGRQAMALLLGDEMDTEVSNHA